ncbi:MAG: hypothetical protein R2862_11145 [Thermoanaerobaculia bacterium]
MTCPRRPGFRTRLAHWTFSSPRSRVPSRHRLPERTPGLPPGEELRRFFDEGPAWLLPVVEQDACAGCRRRGARGDPRLPRRRPGTVHAGERARR